MALRGSTKKSAKGKEQAKGAQVSARIFKKDETQFFGIVKKEFKGNESEAVRELIAEALTTRRLRAAGRDAGLEAVRDAQKEVVSGETGELRQMLTQALSLLRGLGSLGDKILAESQTGTSVTLLALASILHVEDITERGILKQLLLSDVGAGEVDGTIRAAEQHWQEQAKQMVEKVRKKVRENDV